MFLIFDTETTGLPKRWDAPVTDHDNWPRCIQIAWQLHDVSGNCIEHNDFIIRPDDFDIPFESEQIHGVSTALAQELGKPIDIVLENFINVLKQSNYVVGHNLNFDVNVIAAELDLSLIHISEPTRR